MPRAPRLASAATTLFLALAVAACGHAGQVTWVSPAQADAEYVSESQTLQLAPGWAWPRDVHFIETNPQGHPMVFQEGFGTTQADLYWYCSWQSRYVSPRLDAADRQQAAEMLRKVHSTHMYAVDILDRLHFDQELDEALAGHPSAMARDVRLNCREGVVPLARPAAS